MRRQLSEWSGRVRRGLAAVVGVDELLIGAGLGLVTAGLWSLVQQAALMAPGLVLLWIALPQRTTFVARGVSEKRPGPPAQGGS